MSKPFSFDPEKYLANQSSSGSVTQTPSTPRSRTSKERRPGLSPTVRGLPWSKMLRSFREKSA